MSEVKKLLFIVNKYSGTGYQPELEGKIISACKTSGIECTIQFTSGPGHATHLAADGSKNSFDSVIAVGGDGTVNEVAQGLVHTTTPMGILPKGSGNGLARHLGISMKIDQALEQILTGSIIQMDTFKLNDRLSVNVSGIGFDGHVANLFSTGTTRGLWGYAKLVTLEFFKFKEFETALTIDGKPLRTSQFMMAIANSAQYGNNAWVAPEASVTDQKLQLASIKKIPLYRGLTFGLDMFTRGLKTGKSYQSFSFQKATIKTNEPVAFHIDGEPCGHANHFEIELLPHSLRMIISANQVGKV